MSCHRLPQEIIDHIVDQARGDFPVLKALGQTNRQWCHHTRQHLFSTISLENAARCITLRGIIEERPEISQHIRAVKLRRVGNHLAPWYSMSSSLVKLLVLLPLVASLSLDGGEDYLEWEKVPETLQRALYNMMNGVTVLEFSNICHFEVAALAQCHRLEDLLLDDVSLAGTHEPSRFPVKLPQRLGRLRRLTVGDCGRALKALLTQPNTCDLAHPTQLSVHAFRFDEDMATALAMCSSEVETYHVLALTNDPPSPDPFPASALDLSRTPRMKHLCVNITYYNSWAEHASNIVLLTVQALQNISNSESDLKSLTILHGFAPPSTDQDVNTAMDVNFVAVDEAWCLLDNTLSNRSFSRLRGVFLVFDIFNRSQPIADWEWAKEKITQNMPRMTSKRILDIIRQRAIE